MLDQAGTFRARAKTWSWSEAKTGTMQLAIEFTVQVPMDDGSVAEDSISCYRAVSDNTIDQRVKEFRLMGWTGEDMQELDNNGGGLDANEVDIVTAFEEYNGETRIKVQWINAPGSTGLAVKAPEASTLKTFAERFRGAIRAVDSAAGRVPKPELVKPAVKPAAAPARRAAPAAKTAAQTPRTASTPKATAQPARPKALEPGQGEDNIPNEPAPF